MNTFKRKALMTAVLAGLGAAAGTAQAVYQNPSGLGQALIYPYYTVQATGGNSYNTYISVVNTTDRVKVVKVRFREGKNSREVLDFNLYLSPNDMFTGAVVPASADAASAGRFVTTDVSCTNPGIPATGVDFRNFEYVGASADGAGTGLDRTREGYVEMIEMAILNAPDSTRATHGATGLPSNCGALQGQIVAFATTLSSPTGGLSGTGTLINVNSGLDMTYNAIAIADLTGSQIYANIGTDVPNLGDADPVSVVIARSSTGTDTNAYTSAWVDVVTTPLTVTDGAQAVSATMLHNAVINEYVLDTATLSNTDWVFTFPTKRYFVNLATAIAPFTEKFTATGACEEISFTFFNREESTGAAAGVDFSPLPPGATPNTLCWESTILSIRNGATHMPATTNSGVLGSVNNTNVQITTSFQNGWGRLSFTDTNSSGTGMVSDVASLTTPVFPTPAAPAAGAQTYRGLPVVGFAVRTFNNGTLTCGTATCQGNYGGLFTHSYTQNITP